MIGHSKRYERGIGRRSSPSACVFWLWHHLGARRRVGAGAA